MIILGIETSCDETAISIVDASGSNKKPNFRIMSGLVLSQVKLHEKYGGVFPDLAKREHAKNIVPLIREALKEAGLYKEFSPESKQEISVETKEEIKTLLVREQGLFEQIIELVSTIEKPEIDKIAVTFGPGLEPALWVGINTAKALGKIWNIPVEPINHMEGHICSVLTTSEKPVAFPALALLISGGHTELVYIKNWSEYEVIGETRDDAVGEAFDKVARMLGLPYPGGPEISRLAVAERTENPDPKNSPFDFPRPMIKSGDLDFSFAGLKTSVLYTIKKLPTVNDRVKSQIARAFEDAVVDVLIEKTAQAIELRDVKSLIIAGGVIANNTLREAFENLVSKYQKLDLHVPQKSLSTDNAIMIALASFVHTEKSGGTGNFVATGNARLGN